MRRRIRVLAVISLVSFLAVSTTAIGEAKSLAGSSCTKIGATRGDGPGRTVVCVLIAKKKLWQVLKKTAPGKNSPSTSPLQTSPIPKPSSTNSPSPTASSQRDCINKPEFTRDFIDPKYVRVVTPIGEQTGSGGVISVRSYVHPAQEFLGQELPIYAPTDMNLFQASYYKPPGATESYQPEYSLYFAASCGILVKFFHIKGVVGKVANVVPTQPSPSSAGQNVSSTSIKAGEQIGWYKLGEGSVAFDFWVDDTSLTNKFIVQSHFVDSNALHSVCPYDFYVETKRSTWLTKLGAPGSNPIPGTKCGSISQGSAGTAEGMWFISENTLNDHLAYEGAYQSQIMFTTDASGIVRIGGLNASGAPAQMMISPNAPTWKRPSDVIIGETHCWSNETQSVKIQVTSALTMSVVVGTGACDALSTAANARTFYR